MAASVSADSILKPRGAHRGFHHSPSHSRSTWLVWVVMLLSGLCGVLWGGTLQAHPMPESRAWLDTTPEGLKLTLQIPLNRLELAFRQDLSSVPAAVLSDHRDALARYLMMHVGARSSTGPDHLNRSWLVRQPLLSVSGHDSTAELEAVLSLEAPAGADRRSLSLLIDAVTHEVRTHRIQVFLRNDWSGGMAGHPPLPLGTLDHTRTSLDVQLGPTQPGHTLLQLLQDGALHIAQGADHLLFLFLLLIVAPLQTSRQQWAGLRPIQPALRQVVAVVTAFTIGHSLTLVLASAGVISVPSKPVEVGVAATIVLAALHAWRPLRVNGELAMALGFGAIHGLAFSASLSGAGLTALQHALALLAFNIGIELMQITLVLLVMPALLWLASRQTQAYARVRRVVSATSALTALWWMVERVSA